MYTYVCIFTYIYTYVYKNTYLSIDIHKYTYANIYIYIHIHRNTYTRKYHHHHVTLLAWIFLTFSHHSSLSSIAPGRSPGLYSISVQTCCMQVLAGQPAFDRQCEGVHRSLSLMSLSLFPQQCSACPIRWIVWIVSAGGWWPYSCFLWGVASLLDIARCILVQLPSSFFSIRFVSIHIAVLTRPLLGRNCVLFYWSGLNSI